MRVLIDTHIAIWAVTDDEKLPPTAREVLLNSANQIYFSTASVWEVTIKHMTHPDRMFLNGDLLARSCQEMGFVPLPIFNSHVSKLETLVRPKNAPSHNDPFDRILLAQAKAEQMMFLTHDSLFMSYLEPCIIKV